MSKNFGDDFLKRREELGYSRKALGNEIGVSETSIQNYELESSFPRPARWKKIKEIMGIDPVEYKYSNVSASNNSAGIITASGSSTVMVACGEKKGGFFDVTLDEFEYKVLTMFRKYGNRAMGERCLKQLVAMEAMSS